MRIQQIVGAALLAATLFGTALGVASADNECHGKKKRGCEVPEVPYSAILPAATMAGITGFYFVQRRRGTPVSVEADEAK